jgi:DNA-binding MarR family transcriptional regulator
MGRWPVTERERLIDEIGAIEIRLLSSALPEETSSLLDYDLTLQQIRVFAFVLARGGTAINKVASALCIKPNVATGIIQRLVDRGLIERREDARDRRIRLLTVTERGMAVVNELTEIIMAKERDLLAGLSDPQLQDLRDLLAAMGSPLKE